NQKISKLSQQKIKRMTTDPSEQEQELIKQLLEKNIECRKLDDDFYDFIQELQDSSQIDIGEGGYNQMKLWIQQFLKLKNLTFYPIEEDNQNNDNVVNAADNQIPSPPKKDESPQEQRNQQLQVEEQKDQSPSKSPSQNKQVITYNTTPQIQPYQQTTNYPPQNQYNNPDESLMNALDCLVAGGGDNVGGNLNNFDFDDDDIDFFQPPPSNQAQKKIEPPKQEIHQHPPQQINTSEQQQQHQSHLQQQQQQPQQYQQNQDIKQQQPQQVQPIQYAPQVQQNQVQQNQQAQVQQQQYQYPVGRSQSDVIQEQDISKNDALSRTTLEQNSKKSFGYNSGQNQPQPIQQNQPQQNNQKYPVINYQNGPSTPIVQPKQQINPDISMMPDFQTPKMMNLTQQFSDISVIGNSDEPSKFITTEEHMKLIEQFEKQLQDREYLNASQIVECQKVELNKIGKFLKTYPDKKPKVMIQSYRVLEEGFLKNNFVLYTVSITELGWTCYRRYSDFKILRDIFENQFPGYFIPPLPRRTMARKFEPEYLDKRMKILEQFMEAVLESELLRNSQYLEDFLFIQDEAKYRKVATNVKDGPIELNQFYSIDGKINCQNSTNFQTYGAAFRNYTQNLTTLYNKAKQLTKEVVKNLDDSQRSLKNLSGVFLDLSKITNEFNQRNKIGVNEYLQKQYEENSKFLNEYSDFLDKQSKLFKNYIYLKMRYEKKVCEVFEEMSNKRNKLMASFQDAFTKINQKKQKLFDKKDIKQWELPPNLPVDQMALMSDSKLAFKYMLPRETQLVKQMNKKINFFNSNLFYETRKYLKIRETKISSDFIQFTMENSEYLTRLKEYHDQHLQRIQQVVIDSQQNIIRQLEDDRKVIDQSINGTFMTDQQCQVKKA
ncbi:PX domain protein, partial (macronuclear) [Tetrahymena thermophila SB210]